MIKNHPFVDGNKRMALASVAVFLMLNDYEFYAPQDEAVELCLSVAATKGNVDWRKVSRWVRAKSITVDKFLEKPLEQQVQWLGVIENSLEYQKRLVEVLLEIRQSEE